MEILRWIVSAAFRRLDDGREVVGLGRTRVAVAPGAKVLRRIEALAVASLAAGMLAIALWADARPAWAAGAAAACLLLLGAARGLVARWPREIAAPPAASTRRLTERPARPLVSAGAAALCAFAAGSLGVERSAGLLASLAATDVLVATRALWIRARAG